MTKRTTWWKAAEFVRINDRLAPTVPLLFPAAGSRQRNNKVLELREGCMMRVSWNPERKFLICCLANINFDSLAGFGPQAHRSWSNSSSCKVIKADGTRRS